MNEQERQAYDTAASIASNGKYQTTKQEQRPQRFDPIREADNKLDQAKQEAKRPDPPNYKGEPVREYQKQLVDRAENLGSRETFGNNQKMATTDREIAGRMALSGYNKQEIGSAIQKASPYAATLQNQGRRESYANQTADYGMTRKAIDTERGGNIQNTIAQNKSREGLASDDRRTDRLGMTQKAETGKEQKVDSIRSAQRQHTTQNVQQLSPQVTQPNHPKR